MTTLAASLGKPWYEALDALAVIAVHSPMDGQHAEGQPGPATITALRVVEAARVIQGINAEHSRWLTDEEHADLLALAEELR